MKTFFFYDLETSGLDARRDRIMQFAGQRTDLDLKPVGEPVNLMVKLGDDVLPSPYAVIVTGITPQMTQADGLKEVELARYLYEEVFTEGTCAVGYNNVRFDDEFMRCLFWRNFFDPYEWAWKDGRSRWDLLDVVRMTRALRPDGIKWPVGKKVLENREEVEVATNKLELITKLNGIGHAKAHDAMSDVEALMDVARLVKERQPELFGYLLKMRDKNEVKKLVNLDEKREFVYVSGRYEGEFEKATVAFPLTAGRNGNVVVWDLRHSCEGLVGMKRAELKKFLFEWKEKDERDEKLPPRSVVKEMNYGRCPAVAPLGVLESGDGWERIGLSVGVVRENRKKLLAHPEFAEVVRELFEERGGEFESKGYAEERLYDGFLGDGDRRKVEAVRNASERELADFHPEFADERLPELLLRYKGRNFPKTLSSDEMIAWETWREGQIRERLPGFAAELEKLAGSVDGHEKQFLVQELQLWCENVVGEDY
ncbi:exodeoxyribonuclease I [Candidatus Saccharibacteria bacterium]|nr:exodeoxyribonuclease I [Candidatus Saccharibacteria bacterium]